MTSSRRAIRPSDSMNRKVNLLFLDGLKWVPAPVKYAFLSDKDARTYAREHYKSGVQYKTDANPTVEII